MMDVLNTLNIDSIIADPLLMLGIFLLIVGPVFFLVSMWKFIRFKNDHHFVIPADNAEPASPASLNSEPAPSPAPMPETKIEPIPMSVIPAAPAEPPAKIPPSPVDPSRSTSSREDSPMEKTMVMPPGMADVQAQIDIIVAQIKQLNKKSIHLEESIEQVAKQVVAKGETNELKEAPANPHDFTQKLLKLAEHVIALEKEVAKLKAQNTSGKAPIMPL